MSDHDEETKTIRINVRTDAEASGERAASPRLASEPELPASAPTDEDPEIILVDSTDETASAGALDAEPAPTEPTVARSKYLEAVRENLRLSEQVKSLQGELYQERVRAQTNEDRTKERDEQLLRQQSDFQNLRRRLDREREEAQRYVHADLIAELLPVLDNFDRAMQAVPEGERNGEFHKGVALIHKQLEDQLQRYGLKAMEVVGQPFDPNVHEAVTRAADPSLPPDHVIADLRKGYTYKDRLLRAALVSVSTGAAEEVSKPDPETPDA